MKAENKDNKYYCQHLKQQLVGPTALANPAAIGLLYQVWKNQIKTNLTEVEAFQIASQINRNNITDKIINNSYTRCINEWPHLPSTC